LFVGGSLGDDGKILGAGEATRASPDLGFGLVTGEIINIGESLLKLSTEKVSNEGSRGAADEGLGKWSM